MRISGVPPDERELRPAVESVVGRESFGLPVLELEPPLRWASDVETATAMEVRYSTFTVRRGCRTLAAICSPKHAVQVTNSEASEDDFLWVESPSPRPPTDGWFYDPGPLVPRGGHQVMWSGTELIVWGGSVSDTPPQRLVDGAAFEPETGTWRLLPADPVETRQQTAAVWADDRMIVVGQLATMAYDPDADTWESVGEGIHLSGDTHIVWTGSAVAVWVPDGISTLNPRTGEWKKLPDPNFGGPGRWEGNLISANGGLIAVGVDTPVCSGRLASRWTGVEWDPLPKADLSTDTYADRGSANQSAIIDGQLVFWADRDHPTMALDLTTDIWREIDTGSDIDMTWTGNEVSCGEPPAITAPATPLHHRRLAVDHARPVTSSRAGRRLGFRISARCRSHR